MNSKDNMNAKERCFKALLMHSESQLMNKSSFLLQSCLNLCLKMTWKNIFIRRFTNQRQLNSIWHFTFFMLLRVKNAKRSELEMINEWDGIKLNSLIVLNNKYRGFHKILGNSLYKELVL